MIVERQARAWTAFCNNESLDRCLEFCPRYLQYSIFFSREFKELWFRLTHIVQAFCQSLICLTWKGRERTQIVCYFILVEDIKRQSIRRWYPSPKFKINRFWMCASLHCWYQTSKDVSIFIGNLFVLSPLPR